MQNMNPAVPEARKGPPTDVDAAMGSSAPPAHVPPRNPPRPFSPSNPNYTGPNTYSGGPGYRERRASPAYNQPPPKRHKPYEYQQYGGDSAAQAYPGGQYRTDAYYPQQSQPYAQYHAPFTAPAPVRTPYMQPSQAPLAPQTQYPPSLRFQRGSFRGPAVRNKELEDQNKPDQHSENIQISQSLVSALLPTQSIAGPPATDANVPSKPAAAPSETDALALEEHHKLLLQKKRQAVSRLLPSVSINQNIPTSATTKAEASTPLNELVRLLLGTQNEPAPPPTNQPPLGPKEAEFLNQLNEVMQQDVIYDIIAALQQLQHEKEQDIARRREELLRNHQKRREELARLHLQRLASIGSMPSDRIFQRNAHEKQALENELARELHNFDMAALQELDEKVLEQQIALQKAGVPGIFPTKDPEQLALQVKIVAAIVEYGENKRRRRYTFMASQPTPAQTELQQALCGGASSMEQQQPEEIDPQALVRLLQDNPNLVTQLVESQPQLAELLVHVLETQPQQPQQLPQPQPMPQDIPVQPQPAYTPAVAPSAANPQDLLAALAPLLAQTGLNQLPALQQFPQQPAAQPPSQDVTALLLGLLNQSQQPNYPTYQ